MLALFAYRVSIPSCREVFWKSFRESPCPAWAVAAHKPGELPKTKQKNLYERWDGKLCILVKPKYQYDIYELIMSQGHCWSQRGISLSPPLPFFVMHIGHIWSHLVTLVTVEVKKDLDNSSVRRSLGLVQNYYRVTNQVGKNLPLH